ncbi:PREDICTED: uncharacterized protein LOC109475740, partial [Branchiostoma belcheri]|uniref:Uncharacterized protein LOC109475740 n=1 Tax=Branchiostoma belcheri TaxID=7741 RepID=A0A6P4ZLY6_BRABE
MTDAIATIKKRTEDVSANVATLRKKVCDPYDKFVTKSQRKRLGDRLADIGAALFFKEKIEWLQGDFGGEGFSYRKCLYDCCLKYSGCSSNFAEELGKAGIIPILLQDLQEVEKTGNTKRIHKQILDNSLGIMYNISRMASSTRPFFKESGAIDVLKPYLKAEKKPKVRIWAILILAYVIDEKENLEIVANPDVILFLVEMFKDAVDDETRVVHRFTATELAMAVERLAVNDTSEDNNKLTLVAKGVLPPLIQLMTEGHEEEQIHAIKAICQLAFHPTNREMIAGLKTIPRLRELEQSKHRGHPIAKAARGALWVLQDAETRKQKGTKIDNQDAGKTDETKRGSRVGHIMLSYQWDHQEVVKKIKTALEAKGYQIWMDIDQMGGSTLDAMAGAVEGAAVVLICMSRKYKESANCRREASYTADKKKTIIPLVMESGYRADGWLGVLVASLLYFDFSDKDRFDTVIVALMKEIDVAIKKASEKVPKATRKPNGPKLQDRTQANVKDIDVRKWIQENQLEGDLEKLEPEDLEFLQMMKNESPDEFYKSLVDELGLKTISSKRKFTKALENLG